MRRRDFLLPVTAAYAGDPTASITSCSGSAIPPEPVRLIKKRATGVVDNKARSLTFTRCEASFWAVDREVFGPAGDTMTTAALRRMANILGVWTGRFEE